MFTGAKDFNINRLGIISAGRDVNINVVTTAPEGRTLDLQALFSGNPDTPTKTPTVTPSTESPISTESSKEHHRGFRRAIYSAFGKRKEPGSGGGTGVVSQSSDSVAPPCIHSVAPLD